MAREKKEKVVAFNANQFPALREFFPGYLHEDFRDEYGSAAGAARAFCGDASSEEAAQAREEWARLSKTLAGRPIPELHAALQKLGGAWQPVDIEEFRTLDAIFVGKAQKAPQ